MTNYRKYLCLLGSFFAMTLALAFMYSFGSDLPNAQSRPKQVLIFRHAEKPDDDKDIHLSQKGKERAAALPQLFRTEDRPKPLPRPDFIFAAKASKHSNRCVETITPLAKALNVDPNLEYEDNDFTKLARELLSNPKYGGKTVLICWHHSRIPQLAVALKATSVPNEMKNHFDRVWIVTYDEQGKGRPIVERHQQLLSGDSKE